MIIDERDNSQKRIEEIAGAMMAAGRTAPKAKGVDLIEIICLTGDDILALSRATREMADETGMKFLIRDSENIKQAGAVILIGTRTQTMGLNCGYCGYPTCALKEAHAGVPCVMNSVDVGIAIGSMVSMAAEQKVDTRVMFSAGSVARHAGFLKECSSIFAIPISISSKSPFFDRPANK